MEWLLVIMVLWDGNLTTIKTPIQSKELCVAATRLAIADLSISRKKTHKVILTQKLNISTTCLRIRK